ncbi:MAG TPA: nucleotide exchange factor GrpE [Mycobacteriales bacterium]|nr:nucleotide exchange factor GrpE [Mycobacteriales bacterium]
MSDQPDTHDTGSEYDPERVVVRDKRRIDPETGAAREGTAPQPSPAAEPEPESVADPVAELTADLQRLSAEYANYRKRVARDSAALQELVTADVVTRLLPLLDDVDRAREHGDLDGAFKVVGDGLEGVVTKLGVERYGVAGDAFDPQVHEAVMSAPEDPTATVPTCVQVFSPGYRTASGRILRAAKVVVAEPGSVAEQAPVLEAEIVAEA